MRKVLLLVTFIATTFSVLAQDPVKHLKGPRPTINLDVVPENAIEKGRISIKFKKEIESLLKAIPAKGSDGFIRFNIAQVDALNVKYKVSASSRSFEQILKDNLHEERHKLWGFNRWYQLEFPSDLNVKEIVAAYGRLANYIEVAEPAYTIERYREVKNFKKAEPRIPNPFRLNFTPNDTRYNEQWHYNNTGQAGGTAGKDIKLPQAWDLEKGKPGVIIGVIDGGIDVTHPDIAPNMWPTNGFNFVNNSTNIDPDDHGTHTAGTVGAVSNNAIGVSGVAGGDGTPTSGIRLMSLEVFGPSSSASNFGAPFIWSADRGAMISQNSWGYTSPNVFQQIVLDGIDYFIANGGGTVLKGGLVIFASGNANSEANYYPGFYEKVFAVGATNNRDVRSYYSNYGAYLDISAPGGEQSFADDPKGVLSTVAGGVYEFFQGTSMACPHVSGVASLLASRAPGRFSNDDIKAIIMASVDNHYPDNLSSFAGKLGVGRLNAFKALQKTEELIALPAVDPVTGYSASINCPNVQINWTKNAASNDVLIAYSTNANFGLPTGSYNAGDQIPGGGTVVYKGNASTFSQPVPKDSASVTYKIWSVTAANVYSAGLVTNVKTPFSIATFTGTSLPTSIQLDWTKRCPNSDVIVAHNGTSGVFGIPTGNYNVGDAIAGGGVVIYKGPALNFTHTTPANGTNFYRIWPVGANNAYSDFFRNATVCFGSIPGPVTQGFEATSFPPAGWQLINPNAGSITWERTTAAAKTGIASARLRFYDYSNNNHRDLLLSPAITATNADSVIVSFDRAYKLYSTQAIYHDTLELVVSTDCGTTFQSVWKRGGPGLATVTGTVTSAYTPAAADWANLRLDLKPIIGNAASFLVGFRTINRFGQNLYLDNIDIFTVENGRRDATVRKIIDPLGKLCVRTFTPRVEIANLGKDTLKTVKVMYRFGTGALDSVVYTGSLPIGGSATINLKPANLATGGNLLFTVYTKEPNGQSDQLPLNDTAKVNITIFDPQPAPAKEGFEQSTFPPANWFLQASGSAYSWERNTRSSNEKTASAWIRNYRFNSNGRKDDLFSPLIQVASPDSVYLKFDLSHATARYPGSTGVPLDTLEILLTTDCGATLRSVYKKWGEDLSTISKNFPLTFSASDTVGFVPNSRNQWRSEWVDVTKFVAPNSRFQFVFRSTSNRGNNLFLDNIDISTVTLPAKLKQAGFMISPNPFEGFFTVRHVLPPTNLRSVRVMNSSGQTVAALNFNGNASNYIAIDMSKYANGLYNVELIYTNDKKYQTIIKR